MRENNSKLILKLKISKVSVQLFILDEMGKPVILKTIVIVLYRNIGISIGIILYIKSGR